MRKAAISTAIGLAILASPWLLKFGPTPLSEYGSIAVGYLLLFAVLAWARFEFPEWETLGKASYCVAGVIAIGVAALAGFEFLCVVSLIAALIAYRLSYLETWTGLVLASVGALYLGVSQLVVLNSWPAGDFAAVLMVTGTLVFAVGQIMASKEADRGLQLRQAGLVGPYLGTLVSLAAGNQSQVAIIALAVGGGLLFAEGYIEGSLATEEIAGGIVITAYEWLLVAAGAQQLYAYTLPWVIYFAYLGHTKKPDGIEHDVLIGLALASLTIPVAIQALAPGGDVYGLELVLAGLVISILGSVQLSQLMLWWGAGTVLIEGAYVLPKYLSPGSEWPLIAGSIGLVVFAIAVMVHMSHEEA